MAGPVTHIVLALKIASLLPATVDLPAFIVGTSFPDIRYSVSLPREVTHVEPVSWSAVINEPSSFRAGMLFHNLVDNMRLQDFEHYFFHSLPITPYTPCARDLYPLVMKFAEDRLLYTKVLNWREISRYFDRIYDEEKAVCDSVAIKKWHTALQAYFARKPTWATAQTFLNHTMGPTRAACMLRDINAQIIFDALAGNSGFQGKLHAFYSNFNPR